MKRVQMRRGVKLPPGAVSVARPTRWGNPFVVGASYRLQEFPYLELTLTRRDAVALFTSWATKRHAAEPLWLEPLRGHDLACWCPLDGGPCHATVLLELLG